MLRFEKWQATGNDFVLLDALAAREALGEGWLSGERVRKWCHRRRGIGADGLLVLDGMSGARPSMSILNADGSRAEMCGNGLRCAASFVAQQRGITEQSIVVDTDVGPLECDIRLRAPGIYHASVAMGLARVAPAEPYAGPTGSVALSRVDVGNPHAVTFDVMDDAALDQLGPALDRDSPSGSNVEICRVVDGGRRLEVSVYERGVGRTLACGTGACAAAAAAIARGAVEAAASLTVTMPGGDLEVFVQPAGPDGEFAVRLAGPAVRVFHGEMAA